MSRQTQLSIVPSIPCTGCGIEVEISQFNSHTCAGRGFHSRSTSASRPLLFKRPQYLETTEEQPESQSLEAAFEDVYRNLHSTEYHTNRLEPATSRSGSSRGSISTLSSSVGRSLSNASSAVSSVSTASSSWKEVGSPKKTDHHVAPGTHARQASASSAISAAGSTVNSARQVTHSRGSSVSSYDPVSREDAMYRAHPSCMESRVLIGLPPVNADCPTHLRSASQQGIKFEDQAPTHFRSASPQKTSFDRQTPGCDSTAQAQSQHGAISSPDAKAGNAASPPASPRVCRGCCQPIVGKSIRDADGRLSGYWHKTCFACHRCKHVFTTAGFYVIDDKAYCEHDYHELNGSLCMVCKHGIEGRCLETQQKQRAHPRCLSCVTCKRNISTEYYSLNNSLYCVPHGLQALRRGVHGPRCDTQRRTTTLMVV